jgi:hypothetical protein
MVGRKDLPVMINKTPAIVVQPGDDQSRMRRPGREIMTHTPGVQAMPYGVIDTEVILH